MGAIYKPEDSRKRRSKDKALQDLDPSIQRPVKNLIGAYRGDDLEKKRAELLRFKKTRDLVEKK
jgi:hypothetical protein